MITRTVTLSTGIKIGDTLYPIIELREYSTGDLFDAEDIAPAEKELQFSGALLLRQITRATALDGGKKFEGPFSLSMIRNLSAYDFGLLRKAQQEVRKAGEPQSKPEEISGDPSS